MTGTSLTIDGEAVRGIVAAAIVEKLGEDQRQALIGQAVEALLTEHKDTYGRKLADSPLVTAFNTAVVGIAREVVTDYLNTEAVASAVRSAIETKVKEMLDEGGGWLYTTIGNAVGDRIAEIARGDR